VNNPEFVNESYQRFMINRFRELLPYAEVPIKLVVRGRVKGAGDDSLADAGEQSGRPKPKQQPQRTQKHRTGASRKASVRRTAGKPHPKPAGRKGARRGTRPR
jgi:hypothetical protein